MSKTQVLLSNFTEMGEKFSDVSTKKVHREILKRTGKKHPKVLYIPTAKEDSEDYIGFFRDYYGKLGCRKVDVLRLLKNPPPKKEIASKIAAADAIYVNGGNTHRMFQTWKRLGVDAMLKRAHRNGTVMAGHSAGTVYWFSYVCSDSFYKERPFRLTGLGVIDAVVCPHYDGEPVRQPVLKKIMKRTPRLVAIALDDAAAIEIVDDTYRILASTPTAKARRMYWRKEEYVVEEIPQSKSFRSLPELLSKPT